MSGNGTGERTTFPDVRAWMETLSLDHTSTLRVLGELLVGVTEQPDKAEDAQRFTARHLDVPNYDDVIFESVDLNGVSRLTMALALDEFITEHAAEVGPGEYSIPPGYTRTTFGGSVYNHPKLLRAAFPAGTLIAEPCVVGISLGGSYGSQPEITVFVRRGHRPGARAVLNQLTERADSRNPYRGSICRASHAGGVGLTLDMIELPPNHTRDTVVVAADVWREIDLGVRSVRDDYALLTEHGLGCRRGVLLVGPPGVGKSAVSAVVAGELIGEFTTIYVEARAGQTLLTDVVEEAVKLGGPVLIVLEDVDLWSGERHRGDSGGLSELLQAMDISPEARILTLASTNDARTLDRAAIRTGRFDAIVEVGYPDRAAAAKILATFIDTLPNRGEVDTAAVAAALPPQTSGSDLREIVRRSVLSGEPITTESLLAEVGSGRYRAELPAGTYL